MTTAQQIHGVDISHHQSGKIDWALLKRAGVLWMYHKCTEGQSFRDPNYNNRRAEAKKNGMPFGAYHFASPSMSIADAISEARFFVNAANPEPGDLKPALDLEVDDGVTQQGLRDWADAFCKEVARMTGVKPIIYTPYTLSKTLEEESIFWVPRYNNSNVPPTRSWDVWQFSNGVFGVPNSVPGLGHVDLNTSKVPLSKLLIPKLVAQTPAGPGKRVEAAIKVLTEAEKREAEGTQRDRLLDKALRILKRIKPNS
jgi:lysozyme